MSVDPQGTFLSCDCGQLSCWLSDLMIRARYVGTAKDARGALIGSAVSL
jgi:hypothetical protein